jgi:hypothetical protein
MINKMGRNQLLSYLADRQTGEPVAGAIISQVDRHGDHTTQQTDADGISMMNLPEKHGDFLRLLAVRGKDVAFNEVGAYYGQGTGRIWTVISTRIGLCTGRAIRSISEAFSVGRRS